MCCCFAFVSGDEDFDINVVSRLKNAEMADDAEGAADYNGAKKNGKGAATGVEHSARAVLHMCEQLWQVMLVAAAQVAAIATTEEKQTPVVTGKRNTSQEVCKSGCMQRACVAHIRLVCCSGGNFADRNFGKKGKGKGKGKGKRGRGNRPQQDPYSEYSQPAKRHRPDSDSALAKEMRELHAALTKK